MKIAYHADTTVDAQLVSDVLNGNDIFAQVRGAHMQGVLGEGAAVGSIKVWVNDDDVEEAKILVEEWNQAGFSDEDEADLFLGDEEPDSLNVDPIRSSSSHIVQKVCIVVIVLLIVIAASLEL